MRRRGMLALALLPIAAATSFRASETRAEPAIASAREHFRVGLEQSRKGHWPLALASFSAAYQLAPTAPVLFNLAGAQARCGKLLASNSNYRRLLADRESGLTREQRELAEAQLTKVEARIPRLRIQAQLRPDDRLLLDQTRVYPDELGRELWVDPGPHQLQLFRGHAAPELYALVVAEGEVRVISLPFATQSR